MMVGVYQIRNVKNNKVYIGSSNDIKYRWGQHIRDIKSGKHSNKYLQRAIKKNNDTGNIIWECIYDKDDICEGEISQDRISVEQSFIDMIRVEGGEEYLYNLNYNACKPPSHTGKIVSEETKEKIAISLSGRKHTKESKAKMSRSAKGRVITKDTRDKISIALTGRTHSKQAIENMCKSQKERYAKHGIPQETRDKMGLSNRKKIAQIDKDTNQIIKVWSGAIEVQNVLGIWRSSVGACAKGKLKTSGGFIWKYVKEE